MPDDDKFTEEQQAALVELLIAGKRFITAPDGSDEERDSALQLVGALETIARLMD